MNQEIQVKIKFAIQDTTIEEIEIESRGSKTVLITSVNNQYIHDNSLEGRQVTQLCLKTLKTLNLSFEKALSHFLALKLYPSLLCIPSIFARSHGERLVLS